MLQKKYINLSVPMQKELANVMTVTYIIKFIDSIRFIASSLSNLVDNFAGGLHKSKCNDC